MARILIVDDESNIRKHLGGFLLEEGYETEDTGTAEEALNLLRTRPESVDVVLLDLALPGMDGVAALEVILGLQNPPAVVMMSGHGTVETAVQCTKMGAFDFVEKPFAPPDRLLIALKNAVRQKRLEGERAELIHELGGGQELLGDCEPMRRLQAEIQKAGGSQARVLIRGENGTGKELAARAIHQISRRSTGPFVRLNCAAIPRDLIESELFGHERGAFTGAVAQKRGKFELANGGTLFLDEVGDMNLETQAKLLRVLEEMEMERVGGTQTLSLDARVVAATNKDLARAIEKGAFREDLYFRFAVLVLHIPPLRDRGQDIVLLAEHFLRRYCQENGATPKRLSSEAATLLLQHDWTGNVRELRNLMERIVIMLDVDEVGASHIHPLLLVGAPEATGPVARQGTLRESLDAFENQLIERALAGAGGNIAQAARTLGLDRANLHRKIRRFEQQKSDATGPGGETSGSS